MAAIQALESLTRPSTVRLHTDSIYVRNGITSWLAGWKRNGWRTASKQPVKNEDLWQRLEAAAARHDVHWLLGQGPRRQPGQRARRRARQPRHGRGQGPGVEAQKPVLARQLHRQDGPDDRSPRNHLIGSPTQIMTWRLRTVAGGVPIRA